MGIEPTSEAWEAIECPRLPSRGEAKLRSELVVLPAPSSTLMELPKLPI
jgi:hypothetical protein